MFFGLVGVLALLAKTKASPFVPEQRARCASNAIRRGSLKGTSLTLLRVFVVPKPVSSEYVSLTSKTFRKKSTLLQRSAAISPIRSPVSTATKTTVRQGSGSDSIAQTEIRRERPFTIKRLCFQKNSTGFFLEPSIPYTSEASKKENVKQIFGRRGCRSGSFTTQLSILTRESLLAGSLGRATALTLPTPRMCLKYSWLRSVLTGRFHRVWCIPPIRSSNKYCYFS